MNPTPVTSVKETSDREIVISRVFNAPRELLWEAWTNPKHVANWWGPRGFSITIKKHEFRVGGVWELTMHGPDGTNYPNKMVFKEVVPQERIVYRQGGGREDGEIPGANFVATWTFETVDGAKTKVTGRLVFPTAAARDHVVREFGAIEGGRQTLERAEEYLPLMLSKPFVISREFDAPRDLVWQAWTDAEHLARWFGPKGCTIRVAKMDLRAGGVFHYAMRTPDGGEMWGRWIFRDIVPPEKLVVVVSFSDASGGITPAPMFANWPLETLSTTTLTERNGKTTLTLTWSAFNSTDEQRKTFDSNHDSMRGGWGGTMDQLAAYLATAQKK